MELAFALAPSSSTPIRSPPFPRSLLKYTVKTFAALALLVSAGAATSQDAAQIAAGKVLFTKGAMPACAICHTLKDAGTQGAVGPSLDELRPDAQRVANVLRNGLGSMPSYKATLNEEQISALAAYVSKAAGGAQSETK